MHYVRFSDSNPRFRCISGGYLILKIPHWLCVSFSYLYSTSYVLPFVLVESSAIKMASATEKQDANRLHLDNVRRLFIIWISLDHCWKCKGIFRQQNYIVYCDLNILSSKHSKPSSLPYLHTLFSPHQSLPRDLKLVLIVPWANRYHIFWPPSESFSF